MKLRCIYLMLLASLVAATTGCSQAEDRFRGSWIGTQTSQVVGSSDALNGFNYWTVHENTLELAYFVWEGAEDGLVRKFDPTANEVYAYEWINNNEIWIDGQRYEIEVGKKTMKVANDRMEMEFERD